MRGCGENVLFVFVLVSYEYKTHSHYIQHTYILHISIHITRSIDGGANRLYNAFEHDIDELKCYLPHFIKGDLDSIETHVRLFYE